MKKIVLFLILIVLVVGMTACGRELTETGVYEDFTLTLESAERFEVEGVSYARVHVTYTNKSSDPYYALCCFSVRAFQNDTEIADVSDINGNEATLIKEVKNGQSVEVTYVFELVDESAVEVLIGEPTAECKTIGRAVYE